MSDFEKALCMEDWTNVWNYTTEMHRGGASNFPPAIVTCAITGGNQGKEANPGLPETIEEQVEQTYDAYKAGAVMVHIHCRKKDDLSTMSRDTADYVEVNAKIREKCPDIIINNSAGGGREAYDNAPFSDQLLATIYAKPEVCSLDLGSFCSYVKMPARPGVPGREKDYFRQMTYVMSGPDCQHALKVCEENGVKPEFECFDNSAIWDLERLIRGGYKDPFGGKHWLQYVFTGGSNWPTLDYIATMMRVVPRDTMLGIVATGAQQWPILAIALAAGCHVRVGMEDNIYYGRGVLANDNAHLVSKIVTMADLMDRKRATPYEARVMLGLGEPRKY